MGYYEKRLSTTKDGNGTESSKAHHYSQSLPAKMHSVHPEGEGWAHREMVKQINDIRNHVNFWTTKNRLTSELTHVKA